MIPSLLSRISDKKIKREYAKKYWMLTYRRFNDEIIFGRLETTENRMNEFIIARRYLKTLLNLASLSEIPDLKCWSYIIYARYLRNEGNYSAAERAYKKALTLNKISNKTKIELYDELGELYEDRGHYQAALQIYKKAIDEINNICKKSKNLDYYSLLVELHFRLGNLYYWWTKYENALKEYEKVIKKL